MPLTVNRALGFTASGISVITASNAGAIVSDCEEVTTVPFTVLKLIVPPVAVKGDFTVILFAPGAEARFTDAVPSPALKIISRTKSRFVPAMAISSPAVMLRGETDDITGAT
ncbi:hypothetical protein SDC9_106656 [bioreactor metagenome]|uniref:Uncharacterized protein n=1 Tax=bioreactor metagenome TaxID=1076179 RepID=A0A645B2W8_9ZZZZ